MPDYEFKFTIQNISAQKATAIRDRIAARLHEDEEVILTAGMARTTTTYRVVGVDTADGVVFDDYVEATSKADAVDQVIGSSTTMKVALVQP
jgi:hypothetical protein